MPVSLARRIRRIGLLLSTKDEKGNRVHNYDPNYLEPGSKALIIATLTADAKAARIAAKAAQKAKSTPAPVVPPSTKGAK